MSTEVAAASEAEQALVGRVIAGKYRIDRLIGQGGMGTVFQATNLAIGKRVALKFLNHDAARDADAIERFQREALAASVVESSHIVQIFDSGASEEGRPFLVMELLGGEDLRCRLNREGRLTVEAAVAVAVQVLRALVRAHAAGIVHRDLKPDNVFLCERDDATLFVKIVDFGVSKLARSAKLDTLTGRGTVLGTAYYMSPEQAQAFTDIDGRTDLFSVGAILYECLAGRPPHVAPTYEAVLIAICTKLPEDIRNLAPDVPRSVADVIHRALAAERSQRFASAQAMLDALIASLPSAVALRSDSLFRDSAASSLFRDSAASSLFRDSAASSLFRDSAASSSSTWTPASSDAISGEAGSFSGTARAHSVSRNRRTRTAVTAAVFVLAGFAVAAWWAGARREQLTPVAVSSNEALQRAPVSALVVAVPTTSVAPPLPPASTTPPQPAEPAAAAIPSAANSGVAKHAPRAAPRPQKSAHGVGQGLELSTREP